jgi:hypothetical protein
MGALNGDELPALPGLWPAPAAVAATASGATAGASSSQPGASAEASQTNGAEAAAKKRRPSSGGRRGRGLAVAAQVGCARAPLPPLPPAHRPLPGPLRPLRCIATACD